MATWPRHGDAQGEPIAVSVTSNCLQLGVSKPERTGSPASAQFGRATFQAGWRHTASDPSGGGGVAVRSGPTDRPGHPVWGPPDFLRCSQLQVSVCVPPPRRVPTRASLCKQTRRPHNATSSASAAATAAIPPPNHRRHRRAAPLSRLRALPSGWRETAGCPLAGSPSG